MRIRHAFDVHTLTLRLRGSRSDRDRSPSAVTREAADILKARNTLVAISPSLVALKFWAFGRSYRGWPGLSGQVITTLRDGHVVVEVRASLVPILILPALFLVPAFLHHGRPDF